MSGKSESSVLDSRLVALSSPLLEFSAAGLLESPRGDDISSVDTHLKVGVSKLGVEFLAVQAEILSTKAFKGLVLQPMLSDVTSVGVYDRITQKLHVRTDTPPKSISEVLSHEMTHAIDHLCECGSEAKISLLASDKYNINIKNQIAKVFPGTVADEFRTQAATTRGLSREISAYSFETLFSECNDSGGTEGSFIKKYKNLISDKSTAVVDHGMPRRSGTVLQVADPKECAFSQEIIAVAVHDINQHMITHIRSFEDRELSSERKSLLEGLESIQNTIEPAYSRAISKNPLLVSIGTGKVGLDDDNGARRKRLSPRSIHQQVMYAEIGRDSIEHEGRKSRTEALRIDIPDHDARIPQYSPIRRSNLSSISTPQASEPQTSQPGRDMIKFMRATSPIRLPSLVPDDGSTTSLPLRKHDFTSKVIKTSQFR